MKLTRSRLKRLIKEELANTIKERTGKSKCNSAIYLRKAEKELKAILKNLTADDISHLPDEQVLQAMWYAVRQIKQAAGGALRKEDGNRLTGVVENILMPMIKKTNHGERGIWPNTENATKIYKAMLTVRDVRTNVCLPLSADEKEQEQAEERESALGTPSLSPPNDPQPSTTPGRHGQLNEIASKLDQCYKIARNKSNPQYKTALANLKRHARSLDPTTKECAMAHLKELYKEGNKDAFISESKETNKMKITKAQLEQLIKEELDETLVNEQQGLGQQINQRLSNIEQRLAKLEQQFGGNFDHDTGWQTKSDKWNKEGPLNMDSMKKFQQQMGGKGMNMNQMMQALQGFMKESLNSDD